MAVLLKTSIFNLSHITHGSTVVIGLSGGPDSVCLLHHLVRVQKSLGLTLIAAHLDHEWRDSSIIDAQFCQILCKGLEVTLVSKKSSELNKTFTYKGSREEQARSMRRFFLKQVAQEHNASLIALGHHQLDQLETFFIRLIRGTTITGLCGMKYYDGLFIRPLLDASKEEIFEYLKEHYLDYVQDPTNNSDDYLRNRIRRTLVPALQTCDQRGIQNSLKTIKQLQEAESFLQKLTQQALADCTVTSDMPTIDITQLMNLEIYMQYRILQVWLCAHAPSYCITESFLKEIMRFIKNPQGGKHALATTWSLIKKKNLLSLATNKKT